MILSTVHNYYTEIQHYYIEKRHLIRHQTGERLCRLSFHTTFELAEQHPGLLSYIYQTLAHIQLISGQVSNNYHILKSPHQVGNYQRPPAREAIINTTGSGLVCGQQLFPTEDLHSILVGTLLLIPIFYTSVDW